MKISVAQSLLWRQWFPEREYYRHIKACGFDYVDYSFYDYLSEDSSPFMGEKGLDYARELADFMASAGTHTLMAHAPKGEPARDREGICRRTKRALEAGRIMGVENMVYHPGVLPGWSRKEYMDFNIAYVRELLPVMERTGVCLCLENVGRWDEYFYDRNAEEMLDLIEAINHPLFQACVDTGHLSLQDGCQYETIKALGSHLRCLHIQDNYGSLPVPALNKPWRQDLHLPPLMGAVDFDEVLTALKEIGYQGIFNIEAEAPRAYDKENKYAPEPKLRTVPLHLCMEYYTWVHDIAEYMLKQYELL